MEPDVNFLESSVDPDQLASESNLLSPRHEFTGLLLRVCNENLIFLFLNQNIFCGTQKNRLNETVPLSTQNIC